MSHLFQSKNIGNVSLKNRIIMAPMCMYKSDESGVINTFHKYHYVSKALGGVGLIIVEATAIEPKGRISSKDLGLWNDEQIIAHKELTKDCHFFGSKMGIQLAHAGRKCNTAQRGVPPERSPAPAAYLPRAADPHLEHPA